MTRAPLLLASFLALTVFHLSALAQDIDLLPEGQTLITLSVIERSRVQQDTLTASLRIDGERRDAAELQQFINSTMAEALEYLRGELDAMSDAQPEEQQPDQEESESGGIELSTGHYSVYRHDPQPQGGRRDTVWRGSQSLTLEGKDAESILHLAGEVQEMGFIMNQLSWSLSTERADAVREGMLENAIARVRQKAERSAAALGRDEVELAILDVDDTLDYPQPMMRATTMAEASAPVAEAGETEVSLTVRAHAVAR